MDKLSSLRRISTTAALTALALALSGCVPSPAAAPFSLGDALYRLVVGGPQVGAPTLLRFYVWHIMGLAVPLGLLIAWHGFRVRRDGGISSPARQPGEPSPEYVERARFVRGEVLTFSLTIAALIVVSVLVDAPIGPAAQPGALVENTHAPWIFLWVQELLRVWPPAIAGVLTPLAVIWLLALLPYFDWSNDGVALWFNRQGRAAQVLMLVLFAAILVLTIRAALR